MTIEQILEILENYKLRIPPTVFYDLKADIVNFEEPTTNNDLGVDAVSREAVLDLIADYDLSMGQVVRGIHALSSITPQEPKTGHWIRISPAEIYECSECGQNIMTSDICAYKFCHGCGAKMVEPQESEEE